MNARRTHALSFLLNGDLQLMSSGRQTGRRLDGWGTSPGEGGARHSCPSWLPCWLPAPSEDFRAKAQPAVSAGQARPGAQGSREGCRSGEGFRSNDPGMSLGVGGEMKCKGWQKTNSESLMKGWG